jgi:hypothetical protein
MGVTARGAEQGPRPQGGDATAGVRCSARAVSGAPAQLGCERPRVAVGRFLHQRIRTAGVRLVNVRTNFERPRVAIAHDQCISPVGAASRREEMGSGFAGSHRRETRLPQQEIGSIAMNAFREVQYGH